MAKTKNVRRDLALPGGCDAGEIVDKHLITKAGVLPGGNYVRVTVFLIPL